MQQKSILLTGSTGFIGSHTWVELISSGYQVVGIDNFSNSKHKILDRIKHFLGEKLDFVEMDVRDAEGLTRLMTERQVSSVVHFAAYKEVAESSKDPLKYYQNNLSGVLALCDAMTRAKVHKIVFSSSATVYGQSNLARVPETAVLRPTNPYGQTKLMAETVLRDMQIARGDWAVACLRYFNPVGAHPSGLMGEDPCGIPNNLMPLIARVAAGRVEYLSIFGADYDTRDGTGVRDYVHVVDLAKAHVAALESLRSTKDVGAVNIGTGVGYSVREVISAYERASGQTIPYVVMPRRLGDIASCFADTAKAVALLNWKAEFDLTRMCEDSWRWQSLNPDGY